MYLSLLQIKNFRCFDGNEHSITFKKGLNVLVGENDSGKSAIMDAIKLVLGTTDMNWYRVEQEDFYKEDATLEIKITCKFEKLNEDERGAFLECLSYEDENKKIPKAIQRRFPILFIDEAQDTDTFQWNLLKKAFNSDGELSIRQGFGDSNQAIYGNLYADDTTENFPRENALVLSESRRFDSSISSLANTVALSKAQMDGTDNEFTQKGIKHTIFLFEKENAAQVIDEFGQLILDTFSLQIKSQY